ncbi:hypothetical protein SCLCIDRAFT_16141 [Scleroderma citrinum Foug A]|uniref:Uncharacterized protein n=1 Tax=Scleroderma citrinum Foug A TaxID=1036808 RepID=A0A0C3DYS4_9AGAM|nr:hypothetical protein SCLCIDRAFT_16141 [Scleroderma citrinum Foug A]
MSKTTLPTWISCAPHNFGCASHGKLKADQWRTAGTINFVITFCRLWGKPGASQRETEILKNYLSLIIAICFTTIVISIFGEMCLVTNNHLSLHITECLWGFGPAHGWWAFLFERFNGIMQCYKTNQWLGDVELTFIHMFCWGSNLKALMASNSLPEVLGSFCPIIQNHFRKDFRGSIIFDLLSLAPKSHNLDNEGSNIPRMGKQPLVTPSNDVSYTDPFKDSTISLEPKIQCWKSMCKKGVIYTTESEHVSNSFVFFHHSGSSCAGQIQEIFSHSQTMMEFALIRQGE